MCKSQLYILCSTDTSFRKKPWHDGKMSCDDSLMTPPTTKKWLKKCITEINARANYNKSPSGFCQERNVSYSAFTHSWPVPEALNKDLLRLWFGRMRTWRCRGHPSWKDARALSISSGLEKGGRYQLGGGRGRDPISASQCFHIYLSLASLAIV